MVFLLVLTVPTPIFYNLSFFLLLFVFFALVGLNGSNLFYIGLVVSFCVDLWAKMVLMHVCVPRTRLKKFQKMFHATTVFFWLKGCLTKYCWLSCRRINSNTF